MTVKTLQIVYKWAAAWQNKQNDCAPSKDSDQPGHAPSLIRVFAVRMKKHWVLSYPLRELWRLWSDWADAQADLSLLWRKGHFVGFVLKWLIFHVFYNSPFFMVDLLVEIEIRDVWYFLLYILYVLMFLKNAEYSVFRENRCPPTTRTFLWTMVGANM